MTPNFDAEDAAQYRNTANTAEIPKYHSQNRQHTEIPKYRNTGVGVHVDKTFDIFFTDRMMMVLESDSETEFN